VPRTGLAILLWPSPACGHLLHLAIVSTVGGERIARHRRGRDVDERRADPRPPSISSYVAAEQRPGQAPCSRIAASSGLELGEERLDLGLILDRTVHHRALQHVDRCGKKSAGGNNGRVGTHEG
jgi:hypothetical protein